MKVEPLVCCSSQAKCIMSFGSYGKPDRTVWAYPGCCLKMYAAPQSLALPTAYCRNVPTLPNALEIAWPMLLGIP